ncbi:hypothetical protein BKA57DRAFT_520069 [Linnemannia elongata]|nr:hypothetical protein BKA57DRAFT_520069 [Linnemannia elongata]
MKHPTASTVKPPAASTMKPHSRVPLQDITNIVHLNKYRTRSQTTTIATPRGPAPQNLSSNRSATRQFSINSPATRQSFINRSASRQPSINSSESRQPSINSSATRQSSTTNSPATRQSSINRLASHQPSSSVTTSHTSAPSLELLDAELWMKFHHLDNEMIVTPHGRSLFPLLKVRAVDLDTQAEYSVALTLEGADSARFRFSNSGWNPIKPLNRDDDTFSSARLAPRPSVSTSATAFKSIEPHQFYIHPDGFQPGDQWMRHEISFDRIKLSNKAIASSPCDSKAASSSQVFSVTTNHKYRLQLHLTQRKRGEDDLSWTFDYPCTEFIAVTQYQNDDVRILKTLNNPHAAAFKKKIDQLTPSLETEVRSSQKRQRQQEQQQPQERHRQQEPEQLQKRRQQQEPQQPQKRPRELEPQTSQKRPRYQQQRHEKEQQMHHRPSFYGLSSEGYESPPASSEISFSDPFSDIPSWSRYNYPPVNSLYQSAPPSITPYYAGNEGWRELDPIQHHHQQQKSSQYVQQQHCHMQQQPQQGSSYSPLNLLVMAMEIREYQNSKKNGPGQYSDALFRDGVDGFSMFAFQ